MKRLYHIHYWRRGREYSAYRWARWPDEALRLLAHRVPADEIGVARVRPASPPRLMGPGPGNWFNEQLRARLS